MLLISQAMAVDEAKLAKSVEILWENWMSVLSKGIVTSTQGCGDLWRSSKYVFVSGSDDLKVVKIWFFNHIDFKDKALADHINAFS